MKLLRSLNIQVYNETKKESRSNVAQVMALFHDMQVASQEILLSHNLL